jgi:hypothetical protein
MKKFLVPLAGLLVVGLAACGASRDVSVIGTRPVSPTTAPASAQPVVSEDLTTAGQRYLDLITPYNTALKAEQATFAGVNASTPDAEAMEAVHKFGSTLAPLAEKAARDMQAGQWPTVAQADMLTLAKATATLAGSYSALARVDTAPAAVQMVTQTLPPQASAFSSAASAVRLDLGLPIAR